MTASHIILASLPSFCQKLLKFVEICRSSDKNKFAQFFEKQYTKNSSQGLRSHVTEIKSLLRVTVTSINSKLPQFLISSFSLICRHTHGQATVKQYPVFAIWLVHMIITFTAFLVLGDFGYQSLKLSGIN